MAGVPTAPQRVTTEEGLVPTSEIEEGDYVLAYHEETGEVGYYPVTETWVHEDPVLTYLVIEGEFIATTPTHLFYTTEGWVEAGELGEDAYVVRAGGAPGQVWESLTFTLPRQMYDLTVAEAHTFFVGEEQWLVHNNCGNWPSTAGEMDEMLGIPGTPIPDGPNTLGRNKTVWRPSDNVEIVFEQHPYHPDSPDYHRLPHWHLTTPGRSHVRYLPGDAIPGDVVQIGPE